MEQEFFSVQLSDEGKFWLRRFAKLALATLIVTAAVCFLQTGTTLYFVLNTARLQQNNFWQRSALWTLGFNVVFTFFLPMLQVIYYRRFAALASKAADTGDSTAFNRSFRLLYAQSTLFLVQVIGTFLFFVVRFYVIRY